MQEVEIKGNKVYDDKIMSGKKEKNRYLELLLSTLVLSASTFGGGFVIVPLMRKRFVEELGWIREEEMLDLTAIAQSSPGAIAVNAAILVGYRVAGIPGALMSVLGTVLPPLVIICVISLFYETFRNNRFVNMALSGMLAGVAAVILDVVINMVKALYSQKRILPFIILVLSFIAARYLNVNIVVIILVCAVTGALDTIVRDRRKKA